MFMVQTLFRPELILLQDRVQPQQRVFRIFNNPSIFHLRSLSTSHLRATISNGHELTHREFFCASSNLSHHYLMRPTVITFPRELFCLSYQQIAPTSRPTLISRRRRGLDSVDGTSSAVLFEGSIRNYFDPASPSVESFASVTLTNHPRHPSYELLIQWTPSPPFSPAPLRTSRPPLPSNLHRQRSRTCPNSTPSTMTEALDHPDRALSHERPRASCYRASTLRISSTSRPFSRSSAHRRLQLNSSIALT
ncbi:hypothetical protein C8R46DRAFT_1136082 [Mycena filopes]|nr:hypothetical protein C8R46DRAFT_1136082 [Mycena filopes]